LVRLWLRDEELAWKIPEALRERWEGVSGGRKGEEGRANEVWPLEPFVRSAGLGVGAREGNREEKVE